MSVRTDDGRNVSFDLKDYNRIDHGYAATIHKAQGMTVDRTHVLATPGLDAHGSYVALSRHRDGMELHYGRDDFASQDRLARTLSRDRAKDMASDYDRLDPAQDYAERRGITFRERVAEIVRKIVPEKVRGMFDGLRPRRSPHRKPGRSRKGKAPRRRSGERRMRREGPWQRQRRGAAPSSHQGAHPPCPRRGCDLRDAAAGRQGQPGASEGIAGGPQGLRGSAALWLARRRSRLQDRTRNSQRKPLSGNHRPRDPRPPARNRAAHRSAARRADRFVERWHKLDQTSQRQYQAGDMSGYKTTRASMGDMAKSLERDPQLESILANRKAELGIEMESGRRLGAALAFTHGIDLGRGRGIGI